MEGILQSFRHIHADQGTIHFKCNFKLLTCLDWEHKFYTNGIDRWLSFAISMKSEELKSTAGLPLWEGAVMTYERGFFLTYFLSSGIENGISRDILVRWAV